MLSFALPLHQSSILPTGRRQKKEWSVYSVHHLTSEKGQCGTKREKREVEEWNEGAVKEGHRVEEGSEKCQITLLVC